MRRGIPLVLALAAAAAPASAQAAADNPPVGSVDGWVAVEDVFVRSLTRANVASGGAASLLLDDATALRCKTTSVRAVRCSFAYEETDAVGLSGYGTVVRSRPANRRAPAGYQRYRFRVELRELDQEDECVRVTRWTFTRSRQTRPTTGSGLGSLPWSSSAARAQNPLRSVPVCAA